MSESIVEIVYMPLKAGTDLENGEAKTVWDATIATINKQAGLKVGYWGMQIENPNTVQMIAEWSSINDHANFTKTPEYGPFLERLDTILAGAPTVFHVKTSLPSSPDANPLLAPVTECINAYFPPDMSEDEYRKNFETFSTECAKIPDAGYIGLIGGWSMESHQHENLGEGVEGKMFAAFIGWPNIEAHMQFRKNEQFGKIIPYLRGGTKGIKMWHTSFKKHTQLGGTRS